MMFVNTINQDNFDKKKVQKYIIGYCDVLMFGGSFICPLLAVVPVKFRFLNVLTLLKTFVFVASKFLIKGYHTFEADT